MFKRWCEWGIRLCKCYRYSISNLNLLIQSLILSLFTYAIKVGGSSYDNYLTRIDKLFSRSLKSGYCSKQYTITEVLHNTDIILWQRIATTDTALRDLLPSQRTRQLRKIITSFPEYVQAVLNPFFFISRRLFNTL